MGVLVQRLLEDLHLTGLAPQMTLQFANALLHLADQLVACHIIVATHRDAPSFKHQTPPTVMQIWRHAIAPCHYRNARSVVERLFNNAQLFRRRPVTPTTAIGDNLISRHKHMLEG